MRSIQAKLLIYVFLLAFILIVIMGVFSYTSSYEAIIKNANNAVLSSLEQIGRNVENELNIIEKYFSIFIKSSSLKNLIGRTSFARYDSNNYLASTELDALFASFFYGDNDIVSVYIFQSPHGVYRYKSNYTGDFEKWKDYDWYKETLELDGKVNLIGSIPNPDKSSPVKYVYVAGRVIKEFGEAGEIKNLGVIFLMKDEAILSGIYDSKDRMLTGEIMICDANGKIISSRDRSMISTQAAIHPFMDTVLKGDKGYFETVYKGSKVVVAFYTIPNIGYKVINILPYEHYTKEIRSIRDLTIFLSLFCLVAIYLIAFFISRKIASPIQELLNAMNRVKEGNFNIEVATRSNDEISLITRNFNYMVKQIRELFKKAVEEERKKRDAEIRALQYQINPHFLYNILGSIRLTAMMNPEADIPHMLLVLSRLLSRTIGKAGMIIKISQEIENIKDYVNIQQIRYEDRIIVNYDIEDHIKNYKIPNLLLQPIVENAIFHGTNQIKNPVIDIWGMQVKDFIIFRIHDNGVGMTEEQIKAVLADDDVSKKDSYTHIGLKNIDERIKLNYGADYGISISSIPGEGTTVMVKLPVIAE